MEKQPITDKQTIIVNQLKQPKNYIKIITIAAIAIIAIILFKSTLRPAYICGIITED